MTLLLFCAQAPLHPNAGSFKTDAIVVLQAARTELVASGRLMGLEEPSTVSTSEYQRVLYGGLSNVATFPAPSACCLSMLKS